jgi:RNA polymerase subunit RPABC4/transcription elongation factor Spt4
MEGIALLTGKLIIMKKQKFCTQCGKSNRVTAKICIECGQPFKSAPAIATDEQACPECGIVARADTKFCRQCGHRFEAVAVIPPEPPLVQPAASGVVLPPAAEIPPLPEDVPEIPDPPEDETEQYGGKTGILLTPEELEQLRRAKPDQPIYVKHPPRKKNR